MPNPLGYFQVCSTYCCEDRWPVCGCDGNPPSYWTVTTYGYGGPYPALLCADGETQGVACARLNGTWVLEQIEPAPDWVYDLSEAQRGCTWWLPLANPACGYTWAVFSLINNYPVFEFTNDDRSQRFTWTGSLVADCCDDTPFYLTFSSSNKCGIISADHYCQVTSGGCS